MGSSDLNMKKSWHPLTLANQRRVAEEKRKAEEEAQRVAKLQKELREERQREEIERLNASVSGSKKKGNQLEWMYTAPSANVQMDEDREAYLLGKKDIRSIIKQKEEEEEKANRPEEKWSSGLFSFSNRNANNDRDTMAKSLEDPLLDIKRREQAAIQAVLNNPLHMRDIEKRSKSGRQEKGESKRHKSKSKSERRSASKHEGKQERSPSKYREGEDSDDDGRRHRRSSHDKPRSTDRDSHRHRHRHRQNKHGSERSGSKERGGPSRDDRYKNSDREHREKHRHRASGRSRSPSHRHQPSH